MGKLSSRDDDVWLRRNEVLRNEMYPAPFIFEDFVGNDNSGGLGEEHRDVMIY